MSAFQRSLKVKNFRIRVYLRADDHTCYLSVLLIISRPWPVGSHGHVTFDSQHYGPPLKSDASVFIDSVVVGALCEGQSRYGTGQLTLHQ